MTLILGGEGTESEPSSDWALGPGLCGFSQRNLLGLEEGKTVTFYCPVSQWVLVKDEATGSTTWDFNAVPSVLAAYSG